jgi:hypothetical protein
VHDIADLEARGLPGVFVASSEFAEAAAAQAHALGFDAASVLVPHPIQDRTDEEMRAHAEQACERIVGALVEAAGG